ncbi:MAG: hypothetical protein E6K51_09385 [Gammaproteobacteria bacterium]|nr:MAG: hypothetical protein E6K51_09385 [Gammaproteobacteria bacterium]
MEDVIIIGGGPLGFINTLGLAQAGVRVSVIEAEHHQLPAGGGVLLVGSRRFRAPGNAGRGRGRRRAQAGLHVPRPTYRRAHCLFDGDTEGAHAPPL